MSITKTQLKAIRSDIAKALAEVEAKHGITLDLGSISYQDNSFHGKLSGSVVGDNGEDLAAKSNWEAKFRRYGLNKEWFGKSFKSGNDTFTISGLNSRASKRPVIATASNGDRYSFPPAMVIKAFA
jgi:hypothetical protein